jgi:hypothetical protein
MLPNWIERPEVTANLFNPAFCTEILRECASAYHGEAEHPLPFALAALILPLILNNKIRERLPTRKGTPVHSWISENEEVKIGLAQKVEKFVPFTREAIMFGIAHNSLQIDETGGIEVRPRSKKLTTDDDEVKSCLKKAVALGKNLARSGTPTTIYSVLGIRP